MEVDLKWMAEVLERALKTADGHKYSDEFWDRLSKSIKQQAKDYEEERRSLIPSPEKMNRRFDL